MKTIFKLMAFGLCVMAISCKPENPKEENNPEEQEIEFTATSTIPTSVAAGETINFAYTATCTRGISRIYASLGETVIEDSETVYSETPESVNYTFNYTVPADAKAGNLQFFFTVVCADNYSHDFDAMIYVTGTTEDPNKPEEQEIEFTATSTIPTSVAAGETINFAYTATCTRGISRIYASLNETTIDNSETEYSENPTSASYTFDYTVPDDAVVGSSLQFVFTVECADNYSKTFNATVSVKETQTTPEPEPVALDANGTSNCYVVTAPGSYSFSASVKGNGTVRGDTEGESSAISGGASATWMWATGTDAGVSDVSYDSTSGRITFKVPDPAIPGNTIIVLRDASSKILWSWHIWNPGTTAIAEVADGTTIWMDRNLGATAADFSAESYGLLYQFGWKNPIIGARVKGTTAGVSGNTTFNSDNDAKYVVNSTDFSGVDWSLGTEVVNTAAAAVAPMTICKASSATKLFEDGTSCMWQSQTNHNKTMYDPCPPGYRVPRKDDITISNSGHTSDNETKGSKITVSGGELYFPAAGVRKATAYTLTLVGNLGYYRYATQGEIFKINGAYSGKQTSDKDGTANASAAASVRCVKITATEE